MKDLRELEYTELEEFITNIGEKKFRAKQIWEWLWKRGASSLSVMNNIPNSLKDKINENFTFHRTKISESVESSDRSVKFILQLHDGKMVEGVLIPQKERVTACLSTQVGCPLHCAFCATGTMGFIRNLHYSEIIDEYTLLNISAQDIYNQHITNIVFMGMGEPMLNYENTVRAIEILTSPDCFAMSPSRITISTAGVIKGIKALADKNLRCGLAISLHSADPMVRREIMPVSEHNSLSDLQSALSYFHKKTGERITIEYLLLAGVNDSERAAELLARFCRAFPVKVNIIEYNATENAPFKKSTPQNRENFIGILKRCNMVVNVRMSKGQDIAAACGQLVKKNKL